MDVDIAAAARLVAEPARAAMLDALLSGDHLPASELARAAGVTPATASDHLNRLREAGWVEVTPSGRHRYYRLASVDIAHALEALAMVSPRRPITSLRQSRVDSATAFARTCYDHLAGTVGVAILDALVADGTLVAGGDGYTVGRGTGLDGLGIDVPAARATKRSFARGCVDLTVRRPHLAGALGAAVCARTIALGWFVRRGPHQRALRLTDAGRMSLAELGVTLPPLP